MRTIRIRKGLDVPLAGAPEQRIEAGASPATVALLGPDTHGLRPAMAVSVGDRVRLGQPLYRDRNNEQVCFTAPGSGTVEAVNRGAKRALQSVVIRLEGDEQERFTAHDPQQLASLPRERIVETLVQSGQWTAFRTRPFSRIPDPADQPAAIFVTAIDTNPHAPDPQVVIAERSERFEQGLAVLTRLTEGPVYVCTHPDADVPVPTLDGLERVGFEGPHPAGLPGTHIHFLCPVGAARSVWHLGYQDVIAIGHLFVTGSIDVERVVALSGTGVTRPRLARTRLGANTADLLRGQLAPMQKRILSGSALSGRRAGGPVAYLGRYHMQITVLPDEVEREFMTWMRPGVGRYSASRAFVGKLFGRGRFRMSTSQNGSPRAMVSIGSFERVMPLDILPTPLLKALLVGDTDGAKQLGALELDEEDLALCSFVCNGKYEYGPFLRENLSEIEVNG